MNDEDNPNKHHKPNKDNIFLAEIEKLIESECII